MTTSNNKHLDLSKRIAIEHALNQGLSFKAIARSINKDCSTISKEIRSNLSVVNSGAYGRGFNNCIHRHDCQVSALCPSCKYKHERKCRSCSSCRSICSLFVEERCPLLSKPPYVCNACHKRKNCTLTKHLYLAHDAQNRYEERFRTSRTGFVLSQQDIDLLNEILYPLICEQHQSLHHAYVNNTNRILFSERTLYRIVDAGLLKVKNVDLPNKVKLRPRRKKPTYKVDKKCLEGRRYEDFLSYCEQHPDSSIVQMDSVEGKKGGKVLLTIHFPHTSFMLAFLRDHNDSQSVIDIFDHLYQLLGPLKFKKMFPLILTDNGSEFSNPSAIEFDKDGIRRTNIFYCHPSAPYEKGACEVNHELLRRVLPKGSSFDDLTQKKVDLLMSHINSYRRAKLNDKSPYDVFSNLYGNHSTHLFNIEKISANDINLSHSLLKEGDDNEK